LKNHEQKSTINQIPNSPLTTNQIDALLARRPPPPAVVVSDAYANLSSSEFAIFFLKQEEELRRKYMQYITEVNVETLSRIEYLQKLKARQDDDIEETRKILDIQSENMVTIENKLNAISEFQLKLGERVDTLFTLLNSQQQTLSAAESEYQKELEDRKVYLRKYRKKLEELQNKSKHLSKEEVSQSYKLADTHYQKLDPILQEKQALMEKVIFDFKKLKEEVDEVIST